ncbi:glutamate-rich protein 1 isoform X1 [Larimichthys crocea]|uniref:glutamate-rich protein 1 isoform X1 n=2 Tax=Larimichthys crocea TaxID=215358 RepID=UPI000F5D8E5D|nr:glutamate-rich protein 1 isoform X1 [Larimichthys crocea]
MAHRKEVFESKVLQKLYPAAPKLEKEPSPPRFVETLAKNVKRKASQEDTAAADAGKTQSAANLGRRMYTVLPPPPDYKTDLEKSVTLPQLQSVNSAEDPAEESVHDSNEDQDKEEEEEHKRRRRKRKRKPSLHQDSGKDPVIESSSGQIQMPVDERGECISKNRKRKLKKKRHKEKLLSTGLMPRTAALEFTYRKDGQEEEEGEEEEEENNKRRAAEVSDFLRTTMEIYMSDSSLRVDKLHLLSGVVDDLLSGIASGRKPASVLKQLYALKAFVQQKQTDELEKALEKLYNTSSMSADETTAVVSLFRYWITDIFPMQGDKKTRLSTVHL